MEIDHILEHPRHEGLAPSRSMRAKFLHEVAEARLGGPTGDQRLLRAEDFTPLPAAARRYLRFMVVVTGTSRVWSFRAHFSGRFRMRPERPWMACEAWQYCTRLDVARLFHMRLRLGGVLSIYVRDTYQHGHGRMLGRVFDAIPIVDQADERIHTGELVTYLNDAILFAPSMLLGPETEWFEMGDDSFEVALSDSGRTVTAQVFVDERGAVTDFSTTDRYGRDPAGSSELVKARWSTPIDGWKRVNGRALPTGGKATWHFKSGDFTYAELEVAPEELEFDVPPGFPSAS
jgi:hypothetical protein